MPGSLVAPRTSAICAGLALAFGVSGSTVLTAPASAQSTRPWVVALTGRPVPLVNPPANYNSLSLPVVGGGGRIWYTGNYGSGPTAFIMYATPFGGLQSIFREQGDPVAELGGGATVWGGGFGRLAAAGNNIAFAGNYGGGAPPPGNGMWQSTTTNLLLTATNATGSTAPGTTNRFASYEFAAMGGIERLAVRATTDGPATSNSGIWIGLGSQGAALTLHVLESDLPPDVPADVQFDDFTNAAFDPVINSSGVLAFLAPLRGPSVTAASNRCIVAGPPAAERIVARTGSPAAGVGLPAGVVYATLGAPWINESNDIVFTGRLTGGAPAVGPNDDEGLWLVRWPGTEPELVVREGIPAPGIGNPAILLHERTFNTASFRQTIIDSQGRIGFISGLLGPGITNDNDSVIYLAERLPGPNAWGLTLLVREGQDAPDLTPGSDRYGAFVSLFLNAYGNLAFTTNINSFSSRAALFAGSPPPGAIHLMAVAGGTLDVGAPGPVQLRTIRTFFSQFVPFVGSGGGGRSDGLPTCLSNIGTVVFRVEFSDGSSGIFERIIRQPGDFNNSGQNTPEDIFQFLHCYFSFDFRADHNQSGVVGVQDVFDFLNDYFTLH